MKHSPPSRPIHTYMRTYIHAYKRQSVCFLASHTCLYTHIHTYIHTYRAMKRLLPRALPCLQPTKVHTYLQKYMHEYIHTFRLACTHTHTNSLTQQKHMFGSNLTIFNGFWHQFTTAKPLKRLPVISKPLKRTTASYFKTVETNDCQLFQNRYKTIVKYFSSGSTIYLSYVHMYLSHTDTHI
jgi:hypothetical protein